MGVVSDAINDLDFEYFLELLYDGGWYQYVFPFMLVYAIVYTILRKIELFDKKPVKVLIALVFALFAIAFPITGEGGQGGIVGIGEGETLGDLMMSLFPGVTAFSIGVLALYIVAAMLGVDLMDFFGPKNDRNNWVKYILGALGIFVVIYYYARGFGWDGFGNDTFLERLFSDPMLYIIVLFGVFFWWITREDEDEIGSSRRRRKDEKEVVVRDARD